MPSTVTEVRRFLSLAWYDRKFIHVFLKVATPLTQLTKRDKLFIWDSKYEHAFIWLKELLTSAHVQVIPESLRLFTIYIDTSDTGHGAVLMQGGRVVAYTR